MRIKFLRATELLLGFAALACGQSFEVASIKQAAPPAPGRGMSMGMSGGPGERDPELYKCNNCAIPMLMMKAYDVKYFQFSYPSWMDSTRFDVFARVPAGTTLPQFRLMLQNLLAERFKLVVHREEREMQGFEMVIAKGGLKAKEWVADPPKDPDTAAPTFPAGRAELDKDGFPKIPRGCKGCMIVSNDKARLTAEEATMGEFAGRLSSQLSKPVHDGTGLTGKYDIDLTWGTTMPAAAPVADAKSPLGAEAEPDFNQMMIGAIQSQLGLKLESRKVKVAMIVVDRAERVPTDN